MLFVLVNLVFIVFLIAGAFIIWRQTARPSTETPDWQPDDSYTLIQISVPKNNAAKPEAAEQFFAALHGIFRQGAAEQPRISLEMVARNNAISFYIYVPTDLKDFIISQIFAQYPTVEIKELPIEQDYATVSDEKALAATELALKRPTAYPIKTFQNFEVDPIATITGVLSSVSPGEEVWTQMIIRPIDDDWQEKGVSQVKEIKDPPKKAKGFTEIIVGEIKQFFIDLVKFTINPNAAAPEKKEDKPKELGGPEQQAIKSIEEKITKLGFEANIRILSLANDEHMAKAKLEQIVGAFKQFNTLNLNSFVIKDIVTERAVVELFKNRAFGASEMIFNISELATLYHFPSETVATPGVTWAGAKKGEPPANLPIIGSIPADELTILAETNFRSRITKFGIKKNDRRLHAYIIGKTGTGKSTFIENMIYDDIREGRGVAVVDPHGQLIDHVLEFIPENRIQDIVYFSPADFNYPVGFNVLELTDQDNPEMKNVVASGVVGVFKKIFGESWGPRLEYILRNAILALLEYPNSTLLGVMRVLTDNAFRRLVINEVKDPVIRSFFVDEYEKYDPKFRQEAINPIQNKVGQFLSSSIIRNIIGQPKSTMRIEDVMNQGKILLADLSTGKIGEDNSSLLGSMLITKIQLAAMGRTNIPENERRDFYLYVDEFQNFATDSFATILSEARKYRLNLVMVNQYIAQMPETVRDAVFGNVGTMVAFRVGANDAESMKQEFEPVFDVNDLVNQPNRHIYIKMAIDGVTAPAFSANTLPPPAEKTNYVQQVVESSRNQFATPRSDVEDYIAEWSAPIDLGSSNNKPANNKENKPVNIQELPADKGFPAETANNGPVTPTAPIATEPVVTQTSEEAVVPTPEVATSSAESMNLSQLKDKKIEILKDRFSRNWYAVTDNGQTAQPVQQVETSDQPTGESQKPIREDELVVPAPEGVIAPETGQIIEENLAKEFQGIGESEQQKAVATVVQSGGEADKIVTDTLITWEQADQLGITSATESEPKNTDSDMLPIDEIS